MRYTRGQSINTQRTITAKRIGTLHGLISTFSLYRKAIWDAKIQNTSLSGESGFRTGRGSLWSSWQMLLSYDDSLMHLFFFGASLAGLMVSLPSPLTALRHLTKFCSESSPQLSTLLLRVLTTARLGTMQYIFNQVSLLKSHFSSASWE